MKRLLLIFFMSLNSLTFATSYQVSDDNIISISERTFNIYIKPQISAIISEYYFFIAKSNDEMGTELEQIIKKSKQSIPVWNVVSSVCQYSKKDCNLKDIYNITKDLDQSILKLQEKFWVKKSKDFKAENLIKLSHFFDKILLDNYRILHKIEEINILMSDFSSPAAKTFDEIALILRNQDLNISELFLATLRLKIREEFYTLYIGMIRPLEANIENKEMITFLSKRLGEFNLRWNTFQMNLTKGKIQLNDDQKNYLSRMHNRWNNILKSILRK